MAIAGAMETEEVQSFVQWGRTRRGLSLPSS